MFALNNKNSIYYSLIFCNKILYFYYKKKQMSYYRRDMLSISTRNLLAQYLAKNISAAAAIEPFRCALADIPYFDTIGLFRFFDQQKKGFLTYQDFKIAMGSINQKYLQYAFSRIDTLKVGQISKLEFSSFLLPKQNNQLKQLVAQRIGEPQIAQSQQESLGQQIQIFSQMIQQIIVDQIQSLSLLRQKLLKCQDYSVQAVINALDSGRHGYIGAKDFYKFIKGQGIDLIQNDANYLIQLYDSDLDGKMRKDEIKWAIQGLQNADNCQYLDKLINSIVKRQKKKETIKKKKENTKKTPIKETKRIKQQQKQNKKLKTEERKQEKFTKLDNFMLEYQEALKKYKIQQAQANEIDEQLMKHDAQMQAQLELIRAQTINSLKQKKQILLKEQFLREQLQKKRKLQQEKIIQQQAIQRLQRQKRQLQEKTRLQIIQKQKIKNDILWREEQRKIRQQQQLIYQRQRIKNLESISLINQFQSSVRNNYHHYSDLARERQYLQMQLSQALAKRPFSSVYMNVYNSNIRQHLQKTEIYLQQSKMLRQKIKEQREKQKSLQNHIRSIYGEKRYERSVSTARNNAELISPQKKHKNQHMTPTTAFLSTLKKKL